MVCWISLSQMDTFKVTYRSGKRMLFTASPRCCLETLEMAGTSRLLREQAARLQRQPLDVVHAGEISITMVIRICFCPQMQAIPTIGNRTSMVERGS